MFSLFSHTKENVQSIILDIQSGLVRGALLNSDDGNIVISSVVTRSIATKTYIINAEHLTKRILKLISEVTEHLIKDAGRHKISKINYILSSPWIFSELKTLKVEYDTETSVSFKTISDLIKNDQKMNIENKDITPIEQKIFDVKLNGYTTTAFEGKKVRSLEISFSKSFSSKAFLDKVHSIVDKHVRTREHAVNSALLLQYTAMRNLIPEKSEYIYIHIHNELTDIIVVKKNLCKHMASFPFGIQTLLRKIASVTKNSIEMSDSILSLYHGNKLEALEQKNIENVIKPLLREWSNMFIGSFEKTFEVTSVPRTIFLSAHSHFDLFKEALIYQNEFSFEIVTYDSIDTGNKISFEKGTAESNMMKIYTLALENIS